MKTKWMLVLVLGVVVPLCMAASKPVSVELREARYTEEMKGDLDQAIKLYEKIAFNAEADRRYIAEALFRLGTCYAKKGMRDKAEVQYKLVIAQYADQTDFVTRAQNEMAAQQGKPDAVVTQAVQAISTCAEGDPKVKAAMESLQGHDQTAVVAELVKHLDSKIDTVRRAAIYVLWQGNFANIQPAVVKLTELCKHPEEFTRGMAALALGQNKITAAYESLCTMTASDTSPYARRCAAYGLGLMGKPEAKSVLEKASQDPDTSVSGNAKAALGMLVADKTITPAAKATGVVETDEPVVIKSVPPAYANDVSPTLNRISVTFNQTMTDGNWAFVIWDAPFPEKTGDPSYDAAKRVCGMPVKLEPGKVYLVGINIGQFNSFQSNDGVTARPYALLFATRSVEGKPTPIPQDLLNRAKQVNDAVAQYIEQSKPTAPITETQELANDDGKPASKLSISGSGHGVKFTCPGDQGILRAIKVYGSRYGSTETPKENFHVWICDDQNKVLKDLTFPYSKFVRGRDKWVVLPTGAFEVPKQFVIFAGFNPEQTKGIYVFYDKESSGNSFQGLPTSEAKPFEKGDWLIRALITGPDSSAAASEQALGKLPSLKAITAGMYSAMEKQDTQTALTLLKEIIAGSESLRPMIQGNVSAEETVATGLKILNQIREALEQNDIPKAKGLLESLNVMGPQMEKALTAALTQPAVTRKISTVNEVSSANLQKLIDSAKSNDTLIIPDGVYTEPVTVAKSLTLRGASRTGCVFNVTANRPAILVDTQSKGKVNLENLTIKWQLATSDKNIEFPYAVGFKDSKGQIKNCNFIPLGKPQQSPVAVQALGFTDLTISTCRFQGFEYTICFGDGTTGTLEDSLIMDCGHQGIILYTGTKGTVRGNVFTGSGYHAVRNTGGTLTLQDNLIIDNKNRGVYLGNKSSGGVIRNNLIVRNATGINGFARATYTIENNVITDSSYAGIAMQESCRLTIRKNILQGNERGIALATGGEKGENICKDNTLWKNNNDSENFTLPNESIRQDPQFSSPATGDYSLKDGASKTGRHGLSNPEVFPALWKRWQNRTSENEPFGDSSGTSDASSSLSTVSAADKKEAEKVRAGAWQLWQQQKFVEAEPLFQQAIEQDPTNANAWNGYGWTLFNLGRPQAAQEAFEKCISIDPKQGAAFNGLGWIAKGQGRIDEAIKNWEQAVKVLPNGTAAINGLAITCMETKDYAKATEWYQAWLKVEPNNADAKAGLEKAQDQMSK